MRIGLFSPSWPARVASNGIATYVEALRLSLLRDGHEVVVLAPWRYCAPDAPGPVHPIKASLASEVAMRVRRRLRGLRPAMVETAAIHAAAAAAAVRRHRLDVLECEESFGHCGEVADRVRVPVVAKLHGPAFLLGNDGRGDDPEFDLRVAREGRGLARTAAIVAPAQSTLDATLAHYRLQPAIARCVPNPLAVPDRATWRPADAEPDRVLYVGRFEHVKGGDLALAAFAQIAARRPRARLWFVGPDRGVVHADGVRRNLAEHLAAVLPPDVAARVDALGVVPSEQLAELRRRAGVVLVSSRFENQPYAALEAMALGCPVAAFAVGGVAEILQHGVTGLAAKAEDAAALAAAALQLLDDPPAAARLGAAAHAFVRARHDPDAVAQAMVAVYAAAAARR